ncbi:MAG TPA: DUF3943 domain-containing protein [Rhodocyclaceae bacterium]|nr:DUF3943 domain-containing protein [Rhodocyclaceae bacterium]
MSNKQSDIQPTWIYSAHGAERASLLKKSVRHVVIFLIGASIVPCAFADPPAVLGIPVPGVEPATNPVTRAAENPNPDLSKQIEARKSYAIPVGEIVGFDFLLNQYNRRYSGSDDYDSSISTVKHNLHSSWVVDNDPFRTNQLGHPYQGSMYQGFARSAGLDYWKSLAYTFGGSMFWEIAGEKTPPSRNDQVASGIGGSFLGEVLFRMSNLVLEHWDYAPRYWREIAAAGISPSTGFNRMAFGNRFKTVFDDHNPVYYSRLQLGYSSAAQNFKGTSTTQPHRNEVLADLSLDYGAPGKPGYTYTRPFDYFNFQTTASSANGLENVMTHGLLVGRDYKAGDNYRGIFGLYGSYDYIAPQIFRVSSTALSLGSTGQWWLSKSIALQGTALAGVGYAAVGTTRGVVTENDYHYGVAPQALVSTRMIFGDAASLDLSAREYFVSNVAASSNGGHDNIVRVDATLMVRVYRQHAIALKYLMSRRDAFFPDLGTRNQSRATVGIFYTLLGHDRFGAVDWR